MTSTSYSSPHLTCPWTAHIAETQTVALTEANGRIAASTIRQYPPGIPDIVPGMRYTDETIEALQSALAAGQNVIGMRQTEKQDYAMRQTLPPNLEPNPDNFVLPKGFHLWTDKTTCREITKDRLKDAGYVTLVRDKASNRLKGLIHARMGRVNRLFESEEWSNPHLFSAYNAPNLLADPKAFFDKIEYHFGPLRNSAIWYSPHTQSGVYGPNHIWRFRK